MAVDFLDQLGMHGRRLADVAGSLPLDQAVPTCPGWTVQSVLDHTVRVYGWARYVVERGSADGFEPPDRGVTTEDYRRSLAALTTTLGRIPAGQYSQTPAGRMEAIRFWPRRMAHETAIHRLDLEITGDTGMIEMDSDFAADGIDELLTVMGPTRFAVNSPDRVRAVTFLPLDVNSVWTARFERTTMTTVGEATDRADLVVAGMASDVYRWAWNRGHDDEVSLSGDQATVDFWRTVCRVGARVVS